MDEPASQGREHGSSYWGSVPQLLSRSSRAHELQPALEPVLHERSRRNEKPSPCNEA